MPPLNLKFFLNLLFAALVALVLGGCETAAYYSQSVTGHVKVMWARQPITELLQGDRTDAKLQNRLRLVMQLRDFATENLGLPDNGSYRSYSDLKRDYAVWNVIAVPEFSIEPRNSCFLFVGCVSYRGYYDQQTAKIYAAELATQGYDIYDYGVQAYSTLGWFDDPVFSTFVNYKDEYLAGIIFHELAHQKIYIKNDTAFNEGFAVAVEMIGVDRWLEKFGTAKQREDYQLHQQRKKAFTELIQSTREQLKQLYASEESDTEKRAAKAHLFAALRDSYQQVKAHWNGDNAYDKWFDRELNNAHIASVATYQDAVPAFMRIYAEVDKDMPRFYTRVRELAAKDKVEREHYLQLNEVVKQGG